MSGEYHLYGKYQTPFGFGRLVIEKGVAYGETFDVATSSLRFEGTGVRLDDIEIRKSTGGVTGAAWVGWDGNYSFNADGTAHSGRVAGDRRRFRARRCRAVLQFNATGAGTFEEPRYDVKLRGGRSVRRRRRHRSAHRPAGLRGELLTLELEAASPRLVVSGVGPHRADRPRWTRS